MEIKILVPENRKEDLANFIYVCQQNGFKVVREGGGKLPNFSGYYAELKGERWRKDSIGENNALLLDVSFAKRKVCRCYEMPPKKHADSCDTCGRAYM